MLLEKTSKFASFIILASQLVAGCVWIARFEYPLGDTQGSEWMATSENEFVLSGTKLHILPANVKMKGVHGPIVPLIPTWDDFEGGKSFGVLFRISPDVQARPLSFNPQRVHLVLNDDTLLTPSQILGPFPFLVRCRI